jgi:hypothetical protein
LFALSSVKMPLCPETYGSAACSEKRSDNRRVRSGAASGGGANDAPDSGHKTKMARNRRLDRMVSELFSRDSVLCLNHLLICLAMLADSHPFVEVATILTGSLGFFIIHNGTLR